MFEFRPHNLSRTSTHQERAEAFGAWFDMDVDPNVAMSILVVRLCENLERILGPQAAPKLDRLLATGYVGGGGDPGSSWRETAEDSANYLDWPLGQQLLTLLAYAVFGIVGAHTDDRPADPNELVEQPLHTIEALLADCPVERWLPKGEASVLLSTMAMARGRWELDHRRNVSPEALALLGGVKMPRIRNMLSGDKPDLPRDSGLVLYEPAMAWLAKREVFLPTIRREEPADADAPAESSSLLASPQFVPVARDGSVFHPGIQRDGGYWVGPKGDEQKIERFDEALALLQHMEIARWRRPNPNGNWGIVAATEWRRMDRSELDALAG